jgi:uncharacterized protein (DUF2062 family)
MTQPMFDPEALVAMFEQASAQHTEQLRKATSGALLAAMQGRELTLKNLRSAMKSVAEAASAGVAKNTLPGVDPQAMLDSAVAGMDDAMLKAVEANRVALQQLSNQGADLREKHLSKALDDLDKLEDTMFATLKKAADGAGAPLAAAWGGVLEKVQAGGTLSGAQASATVEQMAEQMTSAMRQTRRASVRAATAMAESYAALASGVLLGMAEALQGKPPGGKRR